MAEKVRFTITLKIMLVIVAIIAVIGGWMSYFVVNAAEAILYQQIDQRLTHSTHDKSEYIKELIRDIKVHARIVSRNPLIVTALRLGSSQRMARLLDEEKSILSPFYNYIMIVDSFGRVLASSTTAGGGAGLEGLDIAESTLYAEPSLESIVLGEPGADPYVELLGMEPRSGLWFLSPVVDSGGESGGRGLGWVVFSYDWQGSLTEYLEAQVSELQAQGFGSARAYLVSEDATIVAGSKALLGGRFEPSPDTVFKESTLDIGLAKMRVVVVYDRSEAERPVRKVRNVLMAFMFSSIILTAIVVYIFVDRILLKRLRLLGRGARELGSGNLEFRLPDIGSDEVGTLARAFNRMSGSLVDTIKDLKNEKDYTDNVISSLHESLIVTSASAKVESVNKAALDMLGYNEAELKGEHVATIFADRASADKILDEINDKGFVSAIETALVTAEGAKREVLLTASTMRDARGEVMGLVFVAQDITERIKAEQRLKLTSRVFENTVESVMITDGEAKILEVNETFIKVTGYSPEEVIGKTPNILSSGWHDKEFYEKMWDSIRQSGMWQGEIWDRRKNGEVFAGLLTISAIRDDRGKVSNYVGLFYDITEKKRSDERMQHLAYYDALTNLPNRRVFHDRLSQSLIHASRYGQRVAVMFLDLDDFKFINDTLGHHYGDKLLRAVAGRMRECVRKDITISRLGGDEFTLILEDITGPQGAVMVAERIVEVFNMPFSLEGHDVFVTASIGISFYPDDGDNLQTLMKNADTAMYHAKSDGKNRYRFFAKDMNDRVIKRLEMEAGLKRAAAAGEFIVRYQPRFDLASGKITVAEAFVYWADPHNGMIPAESFTEVAEQSGLIVEIDQWLLSKVCSDNKQWMAADAPYETVSMSLSEVDLRQENLVEKIKKALAETGFDPKRLELEIKEKAFMKDVENTTARLKSISSIGVRLAIGDFGSGYLPLKHIKSLGAARVKIDSLLVRACPAGSEESAMIRVIVALAHSLGLKVVAGGVSRREQVDFLRHAGCDEAQGPYFMEPLSPHEFIVKVRDPALSEVFFPSL